MQDTASEFLGEFAQGDGLLHPRHRWDLSNEWTRARPVTTWALHATVRRLHQRYEGGVLVVETGEMVTFAVPAIVRELTDTLVIDGVKRAITNLTPVPAAGDPVMWKAWCAA